MNKVGIHGDGEVGVDVTDNRLITWSKGDNAVKTWPNGITKEPHTLDMLGFSCAISTKIYFNLR